MEVSEHPSFRAMERAKNLDAEQGVLGGCFLRPEMLDWLELESEAFVDPRNRAVWDAMSALREDRIGVDELTVSAWLQRADRDPGLAYVAQLRLRVPTTDNVVNYAGTLREHMLNRRLLLIGSSVAGRLEGGLSGEELLADVQRAVAEAEPIRHEAGLDVGAVVAEEARAIEDYFATPGQCVGIPTGIEQIDRNTGGVPLGVPTVIGARPGEGKSTLAMNIANHAAQKGMGTHLFTYEDRRSSWGQRELAFWTGIDVSRIRNRDLNEADRERVHIAARELRDRKNIVIEHAHGMSAQWLTRRVRGRSRDLRTKLVIVDYVQLMPGERGQKKHEQVEANMNALAELAGHDNLAVLVLSQLNRRVEDRDGRVPELSDFRDSGSIEQVGKLILALQQIDQQRLGIWVLKNHQGPRAHVEVTYDRPRCRIR
jgi:replicative DNA helicase